MFQRQFVRFLKQDEIVKINGRPYVVKTDGLVEIPPVIADFVAEEAPAPIQLGIVGDSTYDHPVYQIPVTDGDEEEAKKHAKRREAGLKAFATRKKNEAKAKRAVNKK